MKQDGSGMEAGVEARRRKAGGRLNLGLKQIACRTVWSSQFGDRIKKRGWRQEDFREIWKQADTM